MPITNGYVFSIIPIYQSFESLGILWQWINEHGKVVTIQPMQPTFVLQIFVLVCVHSLLLTWIANYLVTCLHSVLYSVSPCQIRAKPVMPYISAYLPALEHNNIDQYWSGCPPLRPSIPTSFHVLHEIDTEIHFMVKKFHFFLPMILLSLCFQPVNLVDYYML